MKTFIALVRDHSGSMSSVQRPAARDYNETVKSVRESAIANNQDAKVSVVELGYGSTQAVRTVQKHVAVTALKPIAEHDYTVSGGGTPLFDAVGDAIDNLLEAPTNGDNDIAYLVIVTTDGAENASRRWSAERLRQQIKLLQSTDKWTFVFRVPPGGATYLRGFGIPEGNIIEWERTEKDVVRTSVATSTGIGTYFAARSAGKTSTQKFYADLSKVSVQQVEQDLIDISAGVMLWPVAKAQDGTMIKPFVETRLGRPMKKGSAFYQLTKSEEVQGYKQLIVRDKTTNAVYGGDSARNLLGLPMTSGTIRLAPGNLGNYDVFVQSTSVNRKLYAGTQVLYFEAAGYR